MSVYIDTLTFIWATIILFLYSNWYVKGPNTIAGLGLAAIAIYLIAQSGWTVAFLLGDVWGRDFSNYMWFAFNSIVLSTLTYLWYTRDK